MLRDLRRLGNCGNRAAYDYADKDVEKIFTAIERELEAVKARFRTAEKEEVEFSLE